MSGLGLSLTAAAAPANTRFFGTVPDQYNMLLPGHPTQNVAFSQFVFLNFVYDSPTAANLVNSWTIFNTSFVGGANAPTLSLGGFTTAPDGTTNAAQKIIESGDSGNTRHYLTAGAPNVANFTPASSGGFVMRLAVFAKAAERTRIGLFMQHDSGGGCRTIFDLAGGQIGVANAVFNNSGIPPTPGPASIQPVGNGWYLCQMDMIAGTTVGNGHFNVAIMTDAGSGTAAENTNYTGNGTSGVYLWRATMLPPGAWGLNNVSFFDDFTDLSGIDMTNSRQPGFKWYVSWNWPQAMQPNSMASVITHSGPSQITLGNCLLIPSSGMQTAQYTTAFPNGQPTAGNPFPNVVGSLFQPPFMVEMRSNTANYRQAPTQVAEIAFWNGTAEWLTGVPNPDDISGPGTWFEGDFWTVGLPGASPARSEEINHNIPNQAVNNHASPLAPIGVYPVWNTFLGYQPGFVVFFSGQIYTPSGTPANPGQSPPGAPWVVASQPANVSFAGQGIDETQLQKYTWLWVTNSAENGKGSIITFVNNVFTGRSGAFFLYDYGLATGTSYQRAENCHFWLNNGYGADVLSIDLDYVRVTQ